MLRFACPHCRAVLKAPPSKAGSPIHCPRCDKKLRIPSVEQAPAKIAAAGGATRDAEEKRSIDKNGKTIAGDEVCLDDTEEAQLDDQPEPADETECPEKGTSGGGLKNFASSALVVLVLGVLATFGIRPLRILILGLLETFLESRGVPEWLSPITAVGIVAVVLAPPILVFACIWLKGKLLESVPVKLKFPAANPEDISGLDQKALDRYSKAFEALGFRRVKDYTLKTEVEMGTGFARLFVHPQHRCYGEANQVIQDDGEGAPMRMSIMSMLAGGWSLASSDRDPATLSSMWLIRRSKSLWTTHPDEKIKTILDSHLERRQEMMDGLNVEPLPGQSVEAYFAHEKQAALDRKQALKKKNIVVGLIEMWLFSKNPKSEYLGSFKPGKKKRKKAS